MKIAIDLETIPDQRPEALAEIIAAVQPPGQYKKPESIQQWLEENAERVAMEELHKTGLNGLHGEICSVAWVVADEEEVKSVTRGIDCDSETELLEMFWRRLRADMDVVSGHVPGGDLRLNKPEWIGHNILEFDLRFLKQRSIVRGIRPKLSLPADAKHGYGDVFDTMREWAGWRGYVSLEALCKALGIAVKPGEVHGSDVWDMWKSGDHQAIKFYNESDVYAVRSVYERMKFHD